MRREGPVATCEQQPAGNRVPVYMCTVGPWVATLEWLIYNMYKVDVCIFECGWMIRAC